MPNPLTFQIMQHPDNDTATIGRRGHTLKLQSNGLIAALKLSETEQDRPEALDLDACCIAGNVPISDGAGLKVSLEADLQGFLRHKHSFYEREFAKISEVGKLFPSEYRRNLQKLKEFDLWNKLFPFQRHDAAVHAIKRYSFIGYDMRLGKTRTAIAVMKLKGTKTNLIVCHSRLVAVWMRELGQMGIDSADVQIIRQAADLRTLKLFNVVSYEMLRRQDRADEPVTCGRCGAIVKGKTCTAPLKHADTERRTCGWNRSSDARCPACGNLKLFSGRYCKSCGFSAQTWIPGLYKRMRRLFSCIVVDESQAFKARDSQQGQAVRTLRARHKIILSGTPAENYIHELYWQFYWLLGGSVRFPYPFEGGQQKFKAQFCEFSTSESGRAKVLPSVKNKEALYELLDTIMTRRTKKDPAVRQVMKIEDPEPVHIQTTPTVPETTLYESAMTDFENWYREQLAALHKVPVEQQGSTRKALSAAVLVKLNMLRKLSSCPWEFDGYTGNGTAKIEYIKTLVRERVNEGAKVLISSAFKPMVERMIRDIPGACGFTGSMMIKDRNEIMDRFRTDDHCRVLCVTTQCCNLGVDLSVATTAIVADLLWSPKALNQMWNRILGINQTDTCEVLYLINEGMIDQDMQRLISEKEAAIDLVIDRIKTDAMPQSLSPMDFADRMLRERGMAWKG